MSDSDRAGHKADKHAGTANALVGATTDDEDRAGPAGSRFKRVGDDLTDAARMRPK
jgi:hypothetical protein